MLIIYSLITLAALIGFIITIRIYKKKHKKKPLVCPFNADCDSVITSDYSSFLGIGLEIYGAIYYGIITLSYLSLILFPAIGTELFIFSITTISIAAFLFSIYLTFIQAFVIRIWCSWCLMSAGISTLIFIFSMIGVSISGFSFAPILAENQSYITLLHLLGFALGVGGATISDVLFLRFLKDFKITKEESDVLKLMSQIVWFGLLLVIISGIGLFIPQAATLLASAKFLTKIIIIGIIILNGFLLNLFITPKLLSISWKTSGVDVKRTINLSHIAFASGAISFVSWYTVFFLGFAKNVPFSFSQLIAFYGIALVIGIVGSQIFRKIFLSKNKEKSEWTNVN